MSVTFCSLDVDGDIDIKCVSCKETVVEFLGQGNESQEGSVC